VDKSACSVFWLNGSLILLHQACGHITSYNLDSGMAAVHRLPGRQPVVWYGLKSAGKLLLFDRSDDGGVLAMSRAGGELRKANCPWPDRGPAGGREIGDGLVFIAGDHDHDCLIYDANQEKFVDGIPGPDEDVGLAGSILHDNILYLSDSSAGRLMPLDLGTREWLEPIAIPNHGEVHGFVGGAVQIGSRGYFSISTYRFRSTLDPATGKLIVPEDSHLGTDGRPHHFLDRFLVFDAASKRFDYLQVPEQPDGIPLICYAAAKDDALYATGHIIPTLADGTLAGNVGDWLVWQSREVPARGFNGACVTARDPVEHLYISRRHSPRSRGLYIPEEPSTPPIDNPDGPAFLYPPGHEDMLARRLQRTDHDRYWRRLADLVCARAETDEDRVSAIGGFIKSKMYYNPVSTVSVDALAALEAGDGRCGAAAEIVASLFAQLGYQVRRTPLSHHVVTEVYYDDTWHIVDALMFGAGQPRDADGRTLSVAELKADPYRADALPLDCFAYRPDDLRSSDGFYVLGYCFGEWGSLPYYSGYLGADWEYPPTLPLVLPAQRLSEDAVRLRWAPSICRGGGDLQYRLRICEDRDLKEALIEETLADSGYDFTPPAPMHMYYFSVTAVDGRHLARNPDTWYPRQVGNVVLAPADQYGWYGVI
jgi:hypothetical protein